MNIIIDSNILFSALIKRSITREIILSYKSKFLFPSYIFEEMEKYKSLLLKKSKLSKLDFNELLDIILQKVIIVPESTLQKHKKKAISFLSFN